MSFEEGQSMDHRVLVGSSHVPAFLAKLWRIVDDPSTNQLICWSETGKSFIIRNQAKFARELLPLYYKHNNMASFVRQLNMYGFHKVISVEQGGLRLDRDEMEFAHAFFVQGNEDALEYIKRKISHSKIEEIKGRPESLNKVLIDVLQIKGRQEAMDSKLVAVKRENEALWRELSQLRQKHVKQQQIVSKLLQFLVSMMSSQSHRISFKRRMPLMLSDVEGSSKSPKMSRPAKSPESVEDHSEGSDANGPVIHEVFEEEPFILLDIPADAENQNEGVDQSAQAEILNVEDLLKTAVSKTIEADKPTSSSAAEEHTKQVASEPVVYEVKEKEPLLILPNLPEDGENVPEGIDENAKSEILKVEDLLKTAVSETANAVNENGSDVISYNPCLFELADDDSQLFENFDDIFLNNELDMMMTTDRNQLHGTEDLPSLDA